MDKMTAEKRYWPENLDRRERERITTCLNTLSGGADLDCIVRQAFADLTTLEQENAALRREQEPQQEQPLSPLTQGLLLASQRKGMGHLDGYTTVTTSGWLVFVADAYDLASALAELLDHERQEERQRVAGVLETAEQEQWQYHTKACGDGREAAVRVHGYCADRLRDLRQRLSGGDGG